MPIGEQPIVANAVKAVWQHVQEEPTYELADTEPHHLRFARLSVVFPSEADMGVVECDQSTVADSNAVCIAREIRQNLLWSGERTFGIGDAQK